MLSVIAADYRGIQDDSSGYSSHASTAANCRSSCGERRNSVSESSDCAVYFNDDSFERSSVYSGADLQVTKDNTKWSTCSKRKPSQPQRSASKNDPSFRGVTFSVETKVSYDKIKDVPTRKIKTRLHIKSFFSIRKKVRCPEGGWHRKKQSVDLDSNSSGSEQDGLSVTHPFIMHPFSEYIPGLGTKMCASCGTRRTPLWRDAEDGTPLCNACGIRYKKYRVRCVYCWHIPKKDGKSYPNCARCGDLLRVTLPRRAQYF